LGKIDRDSLIEEIIKYAVDVAQRRGLDLVVVPLDEAGKSSSNRPEVSNFYFSNFSQKPKVDLMNQPETNFNGYNNWDSKGNYPVVVVWKREK